VRWATANQRVVAMFPQRPDLRQVFVPTPVLVSDNSVVGDARGT
jgi:hypothetical protein